MIRHLMANVVRVEYVFPKRADTYSELDSCVENVILGGYGDEPMPKEAFFLAKEYVDLCINFKPSVELLKWYEQIEINELLEG